MNAEYESVHLWTARNIVNQLFDAVEATVENRQRVNDICDQFALQLIRQSNARELLSAADDIDALHPDEAPKNSAIFLRERAAHIYNTAVRDVESARIVKARELGL